MHVNCNRTKPKMHCALSNGVEQKLFSEVIVC